MTASPPLQNCFTVTGQHFYRHFKLISSGSKLFDSLKRYHTMQKTHDIKIRTTTVKDGYSNALGKNNFNFLYFFNKIIILHFSSLKAQVGFSNKVLYCVFLSVSSAFRLSVCMFVLNYLHFWHSFKNTWANQTWHKSSFL